MSKEVNVNTGNGNNLVVSLLLWLFLGYGIGGQNFYLGRKGVISKEQYAVKKDKIIENL